MATIPTPGSELRHVRKTITFTGAANAGQLGSAITVFTGTGSNYIVALFGRLTVNISCVNPSNTKLYLGPAAFTPASTNGDVLNINGATAAGQWVATPWWGFDTGYETSEFHHACVGGIMLYPFDDGSATGTNITAGTIIVDCWYRPLTDDGALAGDDIDEDLKTNIWSKALSDIASVPAITASAKDALNWLFALARNKRTQTATTETVYKDDGSTSLATSTKSDDGTTYTRGEYS